MIWREGNSKNRKCVLWAECAHTHIHTHTLIYMLKANPSCEIQHEEVEPLEGC
jgi:hypothetical protein